MNIYLKRSLVVLTLMSMILCTTAWAQTVRLKNTINEGSSAHLGITFYDKNGALARPEQVSWWVNDETSGILLVPVAVLPTPTLTPLFGSSMVLEISNCASRIIQANRPKNGREVSVKFEYDSGRTGTSVARYDVNSQANIQVIEDSPGNCTVGPVATPTPTATP